MKRPNVTKVMALTLINLLLVTTLATACAKPAPSPTATPAPSPAAKAPSATTTPAPAAKPKVSWPAGLVQVIDGAKKEGELVLTLTTAHTPVDVVERMRKEIRDRYGVDLKLTVKAATAQAQDVATAIMEYKTGAAPTYDLMNLGDDLVAVPQKEGVFELVDWKSLLEEGTIPEVMPRNPEINSGIIAWSGMTGIMYNPKKVSKSEVPKTLKELGDPKWKGRIGILSQAPYWARWAFSLGKDRVVSELKAIMKNQPFVEPLAQLNNRYMLGEADVVLIAATYLEPNRGKGMPAEWQGLDFFEARDFMLLVRKGAKHPNAAKLMSVYMASPEGVRLNIKLGKGNRHYPFGGLEYDAAQEARKTGSFYTLDSNPKTLEFLLSKEFVEWQKEFELILQGK